VWYFVSNKHYFIEQKRGKTKYVIFLVLGKLLKRWIPWWSACEIAKPLNNFFGFILQRKLPPLIVFFSATVKQQGNFKKLLNSL
jgi:hypothetical protein